MNKINVAVWKEEEWNRKSLWWEWNFKCWKSKNQNFSEKRYSGHNVRPEKIKQGRSRFSWKNSIFLRREWIYLRSIKRGNKVGEDLKNKWVFILFLLLSLQVTLLIYIWKLKGLLNLVVLKSLRAVEMYSDKCFSMSATLIQALP